MLSLLFFFFLRSRAEAAPLVSSSTGSVHSASDQVDVCVARQGILFFFYTTRVFTLLKRGLCVCMLFLFFCFEAEVTLVEAAPALRAPEMSGWQLT